MRKAAPDKEYIPLRPDMRLQPVPFHAAQHARESLSLLARPPAAGGRPGADSHARPRCHPAHAGHELTPWRLPRRPISSSSAAALAGCAAALAAARRGLDVTLLTKETEAQESNTLYAQGGIIYQGTENSPQLLSKDIVEAGAA